MTGFTHKQGAVLNLQLRLKGKHGHPIDLTGYTLLSQARQKDVDGPLIASLDISVPDPISGCADLTAETSAWPLGVVVWDVQITDAAGETFFTDTQTFDLVKSVTRPA